MGRLAVIGPLHAHLLWSGDILFLYGVCGMLVCQTATLRALTRPFAAVGQMALTNYLLHTIICTTIFYGHGLGYYGSVERLG